MPAAAPATEPLRLGLITNAQGMGTLPAIGSEYDKVKAANAKWVREDFEWGKIEAIRGTYDFAHYDDVMTAAAQRGLKVLPVLNSAPSWSGPSDSSIPTDPSAYATYAAKVVARYGPRGSFWSAHPELTKLPIEAVEIWNEPYYAPGGADVYDPARYGTLLKAAYVKIKAADSTIKVLMPAEVTGRSINGQWVQWIDELYLSHPDLNNYFDAVSAHPYGNDVTGLSGAGFGQFRRIELMRARFATHGANTPFWLTEIGYSTCSASTECVTEAQQATNISYVVNQVRTTYASWVKAIILYHRTDWGPTDQTNKEYWFGIVRRDGSFKAGYTALKNAYA